MLVLQQVVASFIPRDLQIVLGWPKSLFRFFGKMLQKKPKKHFGQPKISLNLYYVRATLVKIFPKS